MAAAVIQAIALCIVAYLQVNEGLSNAEVKANTPTVAKINVTSLSFLTPLREKFSKYKATIKDFLQKKFAELKIITSGLFAASTAASTAASSAVSRPSGAPIMQVTRPLGFKPTLEFLSPLNFTKH